MKKRPLTRKARDSGRRYGPQPVGNEAEEKRTDIGKGRHGDGEGLGGVYFKPGTGMSHVNPPEPKKRTLQSARWIGLRRGAPVWQQVYSSFRTNVLKGTGARKNRNRSSTHEVLVGLRGTCLRLTVLGVNCLPNGDVHPRRDKAGLAGVKEIQL